MDAKMDQPRMNVNECKKMRNRLVMIGAFGALVLIAAMIVLWPGRTPAPEPEVLSTELERRDGLLYVRSESSPFTGLMLERFSDGQLKSRSNVRGGVLHGLSEGWHTNGQLEVQECFQNGVSHGLRQKWNVNGGKMSEGEIVDGVHHGTFRRWHDNGTLAEEVTMRNGEPDGLSRAFYPSGYLKMQVLIRDGKAVETQSWADGELKESSALASSQ